MLSKLIPPQSAAETALSRRSISALSQGCIQSPASVFNDPPLPVNSFQVQVLGTGPPTPPLGTCTHVIIHSVGVDEVSQEVAAPEEDDVPQDVGN